MGSDHAAISEVYAQYKARAKKRGFEFNINRDEFIDLVKSNCHYCGAAPVNIKQTKSGSILIYNGIDRCDNDEGYMHGNIVSCCRLCNVAKNNMSLNDFFSWITRIYCRNIQEND